MTSSDDILSLAPPLADARVVYGGDPNQFVDLRLRKGKGPHALAMVIHGGYWRAKYDLGYAGHLCAALTAKGIATANLEYRRVGNAGGGWPGTFADVRAAYQFLLQGAQKYESDSRGGDESVGDIDGDPLLALGLEPVDQEREVGSVLTVVPCRGGILDQARQLVLKDELRIRANSRPIRVDLPSSTEPHVMKRSDFWLGRYRCDA